MQSAEEKRRKATEYAKLWNRRHKSHISAKRKAFYAANKERISERTRLYRQTPEFKEWYERTREHRNEKGRKARAQKPDMYLGYGKTTRDRVRVWYFSLKAARGCEGCGEKDPRVLDFHHVNGKKDKIATVCDLARDSRQDVEAEIAKCQCLCANCHRRHHSKVEWPPKDGIPDYTGRVTPWRKMDAAPSDQPTPGSHPVTR